MQPHDQQMISENIRFSYAEAVLPCRFRQSQRPHTLETTENSVSLGISARKYVYRLHHITCFHMFPL